MNGKTCCTCGLAGTKDGIFPHCFFKNRFVWASDTCDRWQKEKPKGKPL